MVLVPSGKSVSIPSFDDFMAFWRTPSIFTILSNSTLLWLCAVNKFKVAWYRYLFWGVTQNLEDGNAWNSYMLLVLTSCRDRDVFYTWVSIDNDFGAKTLNSEGTSFLKIYKRYFSSVFWFQKSILVPKNGFLGF